MIWDRTNRPVWLRCVVGVLAAVLAAAIRLQFLEVLELRSPFLTFYPVVAIAALYGGLEAGLLATAVSAAITDYFWMEPLGHLAVTNSADLITMVVFLASGSLISYLADMTYRAQARANKAENQLKITAERKKAIAVLQESEERYRVTLSSIGDAVIATDASGLVTFLNPIAAQMTGWESGAASHQSIQNIFRVINEQTRQSAQNVVERVLREGNIVNLANHTALISRDGREIPIEDSAAPIKDGSGNLVGVVLVFHDVTQKRRTQESLKQSEEHYRSLFHNMLNGYAYCRMLFEEDEPKDFIYLNVNRAFETLTGLTNVIGKKVSEVIPGIRESDSELFEIYGRVARTGAPERFETYVEALDMWFSISVYSPQRDREHFIAVFDVITERKQTEQALRESEERLRISKQAAMLGIHDYDVSSGKVQWDERVRELWAVGPDLPITYEVFMSGIHPDDREKVQYAVDRALDTNGNAKYDCEYRVAGLGDGIQRWVAATGQVFFDQGRAVRLVGTVQEITERKRAEFRLTADLAALTRMHALSGRLLETGGIQSLLQEIMDAAVSIMGAEKGTLQLLEGDSLRIVADHGHRKPFLQFFAYAENTASVCGEATRRGERVVVSDVETSSLFIGTPSLAILREAGVRAVQSTPMISRTGALLGILTTQWGIPYTPDEHDLWRIDLLARQAADLIEHSQAEEALLKSRDELELRVQERTTELKTYMARLEESNQALQDFASIASHDLQEPLRKVTAFGNMLKQKCGGSLEDDGRDYLERILNANQRMQSLLTGLLDYSRVATTSEPFKEVDLSDLIGEVLSDLEVRTVKTGGEVHVETLPVISADPTQMRQLFQNLIGNALKFHKPGEKPMVQVHSAPNTDSGCEIIVEDNGIGFEEQHLERIFAPFQRLHGWSEYEGTGMGLAICKKIVERHGGSITARSIPGAGSRFIITLPVTRRGGGFAR